MKALYEIVDHPSAAAQGQPCCGTATPAPRSSSDLVSEIAMLLCYEATRDLPTEEVEVETPVALARTKVLAGRKLALVPILRAGLGMVDGMLNLIPAAKVGHIGMYRNAGDAGAGRVLLQAAQRHQRARGLCSGPDAGHRRQRLRRHRPDQKARCQAASSSSCLVAAPEGLKRPA